MKNLSYSIFIAISVLGVGCSTTMNKNRIPASVGGRSIPENSFIEVRKSSFAMNEQGVRIVESMTSTESFVAGKYAIEIDGEASGEISSMEGEFFSDSSQMVVDYPEGDYTVAHKRPGKSKFKNIVLKRVYTGAKDWAKWYQEVKQGRAERKSISVIFQNDADGEGRIMLIDCIPVMVSVPGQIATKLDNIQEKEKGKGYSLPQLDADSHNPVEERVEVTCNNHEYLK